jgi:xylulokinase
MFLGIDVGTQSVKVLLYDADERRVVAVQSAPLDLISDSDGTREQQASWWITALKQCLAGISPADKSRVEAIGVSGQQHGFVPLGADGAVLSPVKLWCDTATISECHEITTNFGGDALACAQVGNAILPGYTAPKIRWLKNHRPELYQQLRTILLPHDYINYYLTGERAMECGDASGTGLLDIRTRSWHPAMLRAVDDERDLSDCLPTLVAPGEVVGQLRNDIAAELGLAPGIPVATGGGDNMMAALGTGNVVPGRLTVSLGTSGTLFAYSDKPVIDPEGRLAAFCSSTGGWMPLLCTMNCTVATELTRQLFGDSIAVLEQHVSKAIPGAGGVVTLPFFNGERTPDLPNGKGCILGLDDKNYTRENLMRSAMESATFALRAGMDAFTSLGCETSGIRLTGGGAQSATWRQMVADVLGLPVTVLAIDEGAALGAALQAMWMQSDSDLGVLVDEHLQKDEARCCKPDRVVEGQYQAYYERYLNHVEQVAPLYA